MLNLLIKQPNTGQNLWAQPFSTSKVKRIPKTKTFLNNPCLIRKYKWIATQPPQGWVITTRDITQGVSKVILLSASYTGWALLAISVSVGAPFNTAILLFCVFVEFLSMIVDLFLGLLKIKSHKKNFDIAIFWYNLLCTKIISITFIVSLAW